MKRSIPRRAAGWLILAGIWLGSLSPGRAENLTVDRTPAVDIWVYPFAYSSGATRTTLPTFGAIGSPDQFDNRDGQGFFSFRSNPGVPTSLGPSSYLLRSATITLTISNNDTVYDPTYDSVLSYRAGGTDNDAGRPIEMFGASYRYGGSAGSVSNDTPFTPTGDNVGPGKRSLYPTDFIGGTSLNVLNRDVSNSVTAGTPFDTAPFGFGHVIAGDLNSDGTISATSEVEFTLNLLNPDVNRYLQESLNIGFLNFIVTSLFSPGGTMGSDGGFPSFYSAEGGVFAPRLHLEVVTVPEPSAVTLLLCGLGLFVAGYRGVRLGRRGGRS